jgi:uncharacterized protein with von Willebrand factor type A (vWA) domain
VIDFAAALREAGLGVSVSEVDDALRAVAIVGVDRTPLREGLASTLVKDEADRDRFERLFDQHFPLVEAPRSAPGRRRRRREPGGAGMGRGRLGRDETASARAGGPGRPGAPDAAPRGHRPEWAPGRAGRGRQGRGRALELRRRPLDELDADDLRDARAVAAWLGASIDGRLRRRAAAARRGRIDLRRTARAALATGGVPFDVRRRGRRPDRPDLLALCDVSGSVAAASELLLSLLAAMPGAFRRSELFVFVDRPVEVSIEAGHVAPAEPFDRHARSDLGRVLGDLEARGPVVTKRTVLLVLGDARNNRRPPRADRLRALAARAGRVVWLVPEAAARWNTGDSVLGAYAPWCNAVVECRTLDALAEAVRRQVP